MVLFKLLTLLTLAILAQADSTSKIVNGTDATLGQIPYQASLRSALNNHFCGGSIVNERWVISAAHCTDGRTTANTVVVVGTISRTVGGITHQTSSIVNHPEWDFATINNDISLIQTQTTFTWTTVVQPIEIGLEHVGGGIDARVSGWGQIFFPGGPAAETLQVLDGMVTVETDYCRERYVDREEDQWVHDTTICTQPESGSGGCHGDSGGPLVADGVLIGAVSWGVSCALGYPDVFARVSSHIEWIHQYINQVV